MSKSSNSVLIFGIYLAVMGLGFLFMPDTMLGLMGLPSTTEPWIYVVALAFLVLAYYYIQLARAGSKAFFRFSVQARCMVIVYIGALVLLRLLPPPLLLVGAVDLLGAIWTASALRSESEPVFKF